MSNRICWKEYAFGHSVLYLNGKEIGSVQEGLFGKYVCQVHGRKTELRLDSENEAKEAVKNDLLEEARALIELEDEF